jgi:hypothetical protein
VHVLKPLAAKASHSSELRLVKAGKASVVPGLPLVETGSAPTYAGAFHEQDSTGIQCWTCDCDVTAKGSESGENVDTGEV